MAYGCGRRRFFLDFRKCSMPSRPTGRGTPFGYAHVRRRLVPFSAAVSSFLFAIGAFSALRPFSTKYAPPQFVEKRKENVLSQVRNRKLLGRTPPGISRRSARRPGAEEGEDQRAKEGADVERAGDMRPKT